MAAGFVSWWPMMGWKTKEARKIYDAEWRAKNREKCREAHRKYSERNREKIRARSLESRETKPELNRSIQKRYRDKNKEKLKKVQSVYREFNRDICNKRIQKWAKNNAHKITAYLANRRSRKILATPIWIDKILVEDIYLEAKYQQMEVDHIVPLRSKEVCGLHWEGNLQLLTRRKNSEKGNRYWPDQW